MTYLAYDPERVRMLGAAMRAALDELARSPAPIHSRRRDVADRARLARLHLEQLWLPLVERILTTDPLAAAVARLDLDDIAQSLLRIVSTLPGWLLGQTDGDPARGDCRLAADGRGGGRAGRRPRNTATSTS